LVPNVAEQKKEEGSSEKVDQLMDMMKEMMGRLDRQSRVQSPKSTDRQLSGKFERKDTQESKGGSARHRKNKTTPIKEEEMEEEISVDAVEEEDASLSKGGADILEEAHNLDEMDPIIVKQNTQKDEEKKKPSQQVESRFSPSKVQIEVEDTEPVEEEYKSDDFEDESNEVSGQPI